MTMTSDFTLASEPRIWRLRITERSQALRNWVTSETETPSFAPASGGGLRSGYAQHPPAIEAKVEVDEHAGDVERIRCS